MNESSGDVHAKYSVEYGNTFYEETLNQNNGINVSLDSRVITVTSSDNRDDGTTIVLVPAGSDALEWLTGSNDSSKKAYYIDFYKNNKKVTLNGNLNIKMKSCDSCLDEKVYFYDTSRNVLESGTNINNSMNVNLNKSGYLLFENYIRTINFDVSDNGGFVFDKKSYVGDGEIQSNIGNPEIVIRPNEGYVVDEVLLNGVDVSDALSGNFLLLNLEDANNLKITFKKEEVISTEEIVDISGTVVYENQPVKNAKVILHNSSVETYTDENGNFTIKNVKFGDNAISFEKDDKVIGYSSFVITAGDDINPDVASNNDVTEISISNRSDSINLSLNLEDDLRINYSNVYTIIKGDINCDGLVNVTDLVQLRMYLAGIKTLSDKGLKAADIKEDNKIDITDLIKLRRFLAGLESL